MPSPRARLLALAFLPMLLTACVTSGRADLSLADVPADLRACVAQVTGRPAGNGAMSPKQVAAIIAELRASEVRLSGCGRRLLALYDAQAAAIGGK